MAKAKYPEKDGHKVCKVCLKELPVSEFYIIRQGRFQYHDSKCRTCKRAYEKKWYDENTQQYYESQREWVGRNREQQDFLMWRSHVKRKYGLSTEEANKLFPTNNCGICG